MENLTMAQQINPAEAKYAGFWLRFVAWLIDHLFLKTLYLLAITPFFSFVGLSALVDFNFHLNDMYGSAKDIFMDYSGNWRSALWSMPFLFHRILKWLYYAIMESSSKQATLGKMALGLKVTNMNGDKISFARATGRYFAKIISSVTLFVGYIMAGFTAKKQALHDIITEGLVVKDES